MRVIEKVNYVKIPDVSESKIYAFTDRGGVSVLCLKDGKFFWSNLDSTSLVWYANYNKIEDAIEGVMATFDYMNRECGKIMEFDSFKEFLAWACKELGVYEPKEDLGVKNSDLPLESENPKSASEDSLKSTEYPMGSNVFLVRVNESVIRSDYWYKRLGGFIFKARKAHFSDEQALLDFGKTPIGDICIIVPDSDYSLEYANRAILLEHCVKKSV